MATAQNVETNAVFSRPTSFPRYWTRIDYAQLGGDAGYRARPGTPERRFTGRRHELHGEMMRHNTSRKMPNVSMTATIAFAVS